MNMDDGGGRQRGPPGIHCPHCGAFTGREIYSLLDTLTNGTVNVFKRDCGHYVWDDLNSRSPS